jgi:type IV pilus assembly protein PilM
VKGSGIDIGSGSLRLVELTMNARRVEVENWGVVALPPGLVREGAVTDPKGLAPFLQRLVAESRRHKLHSDPTVVLPEQQSFLKLLTVPTRNPHELGDAIRFEAGQHIPFDPGEMVMDWQVVGSKDSTGTQALLGAAPRTLVDALLAAFDTAGVPVGALEIESVAMTRALLEPTATANGTGRMLADLGEQHTTLVIYDHGTIPFTATLPFQQARLSQVLAEELTISETDAEKAKRLFGLDPKKGKGIVRRILVPLLAELTDGIARTARYYREHFPGNPTVGEILLTGGGSMLPGLPPYLADALKLPVQPATLPPGLKSLGPSFSTAIGLAQRPNRP